MILNDDIIGDRLEKLISLIHSNIYSRTKRRAFSFLNGFTNKDITFDPRIDRDESSYFINDASNKNWSFVLDGFPRRSKIIVANWKGIVQSALNICDLCYYRNESVRQFEWSSLITKRQVNVPASRDDRARCLTRIDVFVYRSRTIVSVYSIHCQTIDMSPCNYYKTSYMIQMKGRLFELEWCAVDSREEKKRIWLV